MTSYSTYSRTVLSDQQKLVELIQKYSDPKAAVVRELDTDIKRLNVITAKALNDAIKHPHAQFLYYTINTYAEYLRAVRAIYETKYNILQERLYIEESVRRFQENIDQVEGEDFEQLTDIVNKLEEQYVSLIELDNELDASLERLSQVVDEVTAVITNEDLKWDTFRQTYAQKIADTFAQLDFPLSDMERDELLSQDSWESMLQQVTDLKINLPNNIDVTHPSYSTYFQLKAYLAMYSSLSRRMLPNSPEEIQAL